MMRDALKDDDFWSKWTEHYLYEARHRQEKLTEKFAAEEYRPQYLCDLSKNFFLIALHRYSRGDLLLDFMPYIEPLLNYWEESNRLGLKFWTPEQQRIRHTWSVNLDFYIDCFWLVGLALALEIPQQQWQRLIALIGNDGEDALLDRIIATRSPSRRIGDSLCYPRPYAKLMEAIDAPAQLQPALLERFVSGWYRDVASAAKSGREKQAVPYKAPYWHRYHEMEGGYFGYWCLEAVAAVKAFGLDDSRCVGHPHYPGDLLRPGVVTPPDMSRLLPELASSIGKPPLPPFTGEPRTITHWEALKLLVKNKFNR